MNGICTGMASISYALRNIRPALVQTATLLLCFFSGLGLDHFEHLGPSIVVLTVVLGLSLGRTQRFRDTRHRLIALGTLPLISIACNEVGRLFIEHPDVADTLFVASLGGGIWLRRFGARGQRLGTLISLPFIALLVTPIPVIPGTLPSVARSMLWSAVAAVIAFCWVWAAQVLAERLHFVPPLPNAPHGKAAAAKQSSARIPPSSRLALQMALSLGFAFFIGRTFFSPHWTWIVLTAFVVNSGNRGRADVMYKCLLRIAGAAIGTIAATLLAGLFEPGDNIAIVLILIALALCGWLRNLNYAYWAGCVTSVLSLLQGYFGETHIGLLGERLVQILLGGALSVAIAWFVLPIKSDGVLRRRIADCLAIVQNAIAAVQDEPQALPQHAAAFGASLDQLNLVAPPILAHRHIHRYWHRFKKADARAHPADAVEAVRACAGPLATLAQERTQLADISAGLLRGVSGNIAGARRFLGRREGARYRELDRPEQDADSPATAALRRIDASMHVISGVFSITYLRVANPRAQPVEA